MANTVDSTRQLAGALHYSPGAYWCPRCWTFTLDCEYLVPPLETRLVPVEDYLIRAVRYDRALRILEIHLHAGGAHQHFGVPLDLALKIVRSPLPADVYNASVAAKRFPFKRVRGISYS